MRVHVGEPPSEALLAANHGGHLVVETIGTHGAPDVHMANFDHAVVGVGSAAANGQVVP